MKHETLSIILHKLDISYALYRQSLDYIKKNGTTKDSGKAAASAA